MPQMPYESKVEEDLVPKIDNDIAVGEDLDFQRKWWRFENIVWPILLLIVVIDLFGGFGRGWLAKAQKSTQDGAVTLDYERIERGSTPSIMTFQFGANAVHRGQIVLFVSDSLVKPLGAQRVSPQPAVSIVGSGGITYEFPAIEGVKSVQIELQPSFIGVHRFYVQAQGSQPIEGAIAVLP